MHTTSDITIPAASSAIYNRMAAHSLFRSILHITVRMTSGAHPCLNLFGGPLLPKEQISLPSLIQT